MVFTSALLQMGPTLYLAHINMRKNSANIEFPVIYLNHTHRDLMVDGMIIFVLYYCVVFGPERLFMI